MFYVEEQHKTRRLDFALIHIGPTVIVFLAFLGLTLWSASEARSIVKTNRTQILARNTQQTQSKIQDRLQSYEDILRAGSGLLYGSDSVTRKEWSEFIGIFEIPQRYPGISVVGYMPVIPGAQLAEFENQVRSSDLPYFSVFPVGDRASYSPVLFMDPKNEQTLTAAGFDMFSEASRKFALDAARDSGRTAVTESIKLRSADPSKTGDPGFLMFVPMYSGRSVPPNLEERRASLSGYIYARFVNLDLLGKIDENHDKNYGFEVYDGEVAADRLIYKSPSVDRINHTGYSQTLTKAFMINNRQWTIRASIDPAILATSERNKPSSVLFGGILFSVFVAGFIYLLLVNRTNDLAQKEDREIQAAKDELLALASHQLRTPATGVKQYIGMLREGYAGELSEEQMTYLNKAHASNERQLGTINEMLFVARADAGNIELSTSLFNLNTLLQDLLEEQVSVFKSRNQTLTSVMPDHDLMIQGDPIYIRMAIENILSNATKYSPDGGQIHLSLKATGEEAEIIIKDTGVGVEAKDFPLLFQKFSRIPNEFTNKVSGSGIGLYLSQKIIMAHHGTIHFSSELGIGSSFRICLPFKQDE